MKVDELDSFQSGALSRNVLPIVMDFVVVGVGLRSLACLHFILCFGSVKFKGRFQVVIVVVCIGHSEVEVA